MEEKMDFSFFLFEMGYFGLFYFFPSSCPWLWHTLVHNPNAGINGTKPSLCHD
jgi:hypothetical protein